MREMCGRIFVIGKYKHKKSANKFLENKILYLTFGTEIWLDKGTAADPGRGAAVGIKSSMAVGMAGNERRPCRLDSGVMSGEWVSCRSSSWPL